MKLSSYRQDYYGYSAAASNVGRQAAFAGIALIWIFKVDGGATSVALPRELMIPTIGFIVALSLDLLHYVTATAIWGFYCRYKEKEFGPGNDEEFHAPAYFNMPALLCFWGKLIAVMAAYAFLLTYTLTSVNFVATPLS